MSKPVFIDIADYTIDTAFPATEAESYLCGLVCDLVRASKTLRVDWLLDLVTIAENRTGIMQNMLVRSERAEFLRLQSQCPLSLVYDQYPFRESLSLLSLRKAVVDVDVDVMIGPKWEEVRPDYPKVDCQFLGLILQAGGMLRLFQSGWPT